MENLASACQKSFSSIWQRLFSGKLQEIMKNSAFIFAKSLASARQKLCLGESIHHLKAYLCRPIVFPVTLFWIQLFYFVSVSITGFSVLKVLKPKNNLVRPKDIDMFFMSASAVTVSSMSTVEMEVFSNSQLLFMTILMLVGGEVFTSLFSIQLLKSDFSKSDGMSAKNTEEGTELNLVPVENGESNTFHKTDIKCIAADTYLRNNSLKYLSFVISGYILVIVIGGLIMVLAYLSIVPSASRVLRKKDLQLHTFSIFTVVSTFANCGFLPTNENIMVFKNNPGLLLILLPQVLLGNTLFPSCLRAILWLLGKLTRKEEYEYLLKYTREIRFRHLIPTRHSLNLVFTVFGFILVQFVIFCCMEWNSGALHGMTSYQKIVGALFQAVNSRHAGESVVDMSIISPSVLVVFAVMMYLPAYTSFLAIKDQRNNGKRKVHRGHIVESLLFSHLSYLVIFVVVICITERKKMKEDPLNFSLFNIIFEVTSTYGNVGFTTGYSCQRQIYPNGHCDNASYGFAGRWSNEGKVILILVMYFGRLKKFNVGGKSWKLL